MCIRDRPEIERAVAQPEVQDALRGKVDLADEIALGGAAQPETQDAPRQL